jgi:hypothetical protein
VAAQPKTPAATDRPTVTWEQARSFRLARMHVSHPLGPRSLGRVVRAIGGLHAQVASAAEIQAAVRAAGLTAGALDRALWEQRTLVKTWAMRGTLHLVDADDFPSWAAALETRTAWRRPVWLRAFRLTLEDIEAALDAIAEALDGRCLTRQGLADEVHRRLHNDAVDARLRSGWGELLKVAALHGLLCFGPSRGRNVTFVRPDQWVPGWRKVDPEAAIARVCRRYLSAHGPATREEFARWWGFFPPDATRVLRALGDDLCEVDRNGDKALVLRRDVRALAAAREDDVVRLLGMFDPYTLAGLPHDAVVPARYKALVYRTGAWVSQVVLRGGRVVGVWNHDRKIAGTRVTVRLFGARTASRTSIERSLARLEQYIGPLSHLRIE